MRTTTRVPGSLALTALPLALLAGTAAAAPSSAAPAAPQAPRASFVLDADTGTFDTGGVSTQSATAGVRTVATLDGAATDALILKSGDTQVLANTTFADSPDRNARAAWAANSRFVDLSWPDIKGDGTYTVYKDGRAIATTTGHSLRDTNVTPGEEARYAISGVAGDNGHNWSFTVSVPASSDRATLASTAKQADAKAKKYVKTKVVYRVFISAKSLKISKKAGIAMRLQVLRRQARLQGRQPLVLIQDLRSRLSCAAGRQRLLEAVQVRVLPCYGQDPCPEQQGQGRRHQARQRQEDRLQGDEQVQRQDP